MKCALLVTIAGACLLQVGAAGPAAAQGRPVLTSQQCTALTGSVIPARDIGMPTSGAKITSAAVLAADPQGRGHPAYCLVVGEIAPVDPSAPNINFNVGLPLAWNGKAFMLGGGGFDGMIPPVTESPLNTEGGPPPLARGYAVFSSDGGHQSPGSPLAPDASFALNREAFLNYEGDAIKKTRDAALSVIQHAYGGPPARAYIAGASGGGREALLAAARWPSDWDGVVSLYPARNGLLVSLGALHMSQALAAPGAYLPPAKRALLYRTALARCDGLDGVKDGLISNVRGCRAVFDPATASLDGSPLLCPGGGVSGPTCLSDAELAALRAIEHSSPLPFTVGEATSLPGFNVYTADTGRPPTSQEQSMVTLFGFGMAPPASPPKPGMSFSFAIATQALRYMIMKAPGVDPLIFDIANPGPYADDLRAAAAVDPQDLTMASFARKGGKMLILQGTDDLVVSPRATEAYYAYLRTSLGEVAARRMVRFYEVPGFAHTTSAIFNARWDPVSAIEAWVEHGVDPADHMVVTDTTGLPGRTRPLCPYPEWARYQGGDANSAAAFVCTRH